MALDLKWTKRADKKFDKIIEYLISEWNENVAKNFILKVYNFLDILSQFPEIGSLENKERAIRGFVIAKQVTIFYRIKGNTIIILNFFDNRRNPIKKRF